MRDEGHDDGDHEDRDGPPHLVAIDERHVDEVGREGHGGREKNPAGTL